MSSKKNSLDFENDSQKKKASQNDFYSKPQQMESTQQIEEISINNFFGINLEKSPNTTWKYIGKDKNETIYEYTGIDSTKYIFESCSAHIFPNRQTEFLFSITFNLEKAQKIVYMLEHAFGGNTMDSLWEYSSENIHKLLECYNYIKWEYKGCQIAYLYMEDDEKLSLLVKTPFYNSEFLDKNDLIFDDIIITSNGFKLPVEMSRFNAQVPKLKKYLLFFENKDWIDEESIPNFMASMLINGELHAFDLNTRKIYFKYTNQEIEKKMKEGYCATIAVTDYEIKKDNIEIILYVEFIKLNNERNIGKEHKNYDTTYELNYIDEQNHDQSKVIKNANMNSFVVGIKFRDNYKNLLANLQIGMELLIKAEPDNEYDKNALAVYNGEEQLGYIPKKDIPAVTLNLEDACTTAEIINIDEEHIQLIIPVKFTKLINMSDNELKGFTFSKTERIKDDTGYHEFISPISKEQFVEGINNQRKK